MSEKCTHRKTGKSTITYNRTELTVWVYVAGLIPFGKIKKRNDLSKWMCKHKLFILLKNVIVSSTNVRLHTVNKRSLHRIGSITNIQRNEDGNRRSQNQIRRLRQNMPFLLQAKSLHEVNI